ncbi:LysR family transcriptional regulator [uncultured Lactobacillus sp.]|uniref:LysR family transcriptional regulator n=1 Tax=uncultured Lactobacillus sp. TaxID=153152 RepID=UPI00262D7F53|nr:LysR family transcriptional regulator [uncultured Lactobacillus sp.]
MIDNYLLEELVAFNKYKTLAQTAEHLGLSQPAITRGTKKLEQELGLQLFERMPNKITLNETGKFAAQKAAEVLTVNQNFTKEVQNFDQSQKEISVASVAPGPLVLLDKLSQKGLRIENELLANKNIAQLLLDQQYTVVFTNEALKDKNIASSYLGMESLIVNLNEFTPLANKKNVTFKELQGMSFVVLQQIGIWRDLIQEQIPDAKFLYQNNRNDFDEIKNYSIFPYFTTNISRINRVWQKQEMTDRRPVKIADKVATMTFYANYLTKNKNRLMPLITSLQDIWAKVD